MNIFFIIFAHFITMPLKDNDDFNFQLQVKLKGNYNHKIVLWYMNSEQKWVKDTAALINKTYIFQGKINQPIYSHIYGLGNNGRASFYLEPQKQTIIIDADNFSKFKFEGSNTQKQADIFSLQELKIHKKLNLIISKIESLNNKKTDSLSKKDGKNKSDKLLKKRDFLHTKEKNNAIRFIETHPDSYVSPIILNRFISYDLNEIDIAKKLYVNLTSRIKKSYWGNQINISLNKLELNIPAFDFSTKDISLNTISLSQYRGTFILIHFWATWCVPCVAELPALKKLREKYNDNELTIISISLDRKIEDLKKGIEKYQLNWINVFEDYELLDKFSISRAIPVTFLINSEGKIIYNRLYETDFEELSRLNKILTDNIR